MVIKTLLTLTIVWTTITSLNNVGASEVKTNIDDSDTATRPESRSRTTSLTRELNLDHEFLTINGQKLSLKAIYDEIPATTSFLHVGPKIAEAFLSHQELTISGAPRKVEEVCLGGTYTPRTFKNDPAIKQYSWTSSIEDSPTRVAEVISGTAATLMPELKQSIFLLGPARSGKSVALAKIQEALLQLRPSLWTIHVNLIDPNYREELTFENLVKKAVGPDYSDFFYNLLELNPKKIVLLLDGMDHMTVDDVIKAELIAKTVVDRGAWVILTGRQKTVHQLSSLTGVQLTIPEMTSQETETFLFNYWNSQVMNSMPPGPSTRPLDYGEIHQRLNYYVQTFTHMLFKTSLPRQPISLRVLADIFTRKSTMSAIYSTTCYDYVFNPSKTAPALLDALENLVINKNTLYGKIIRRLEDNSNRCILQCIALAMKEFARNTASDSLPHLQKYMESHNDLLTEEKPLNLVDFIADDKYEFIHPEIQSFYVAKFVASNYYPLKCRLEVLEIILKDSRFNREMEFLNHQVEDLPYPPLPFLSEKFPGEIMLNIIDRGQDHLFIYIYNNIKDSLVQDPVYRRAYRDLLLFTPTTYIEAEHQRILGMTRTSDQHPNPYAKGKLQVPVTRMELLVKLNMFEALERTLTFFRLWEWYVERDLLDVAVTRAVPNLQIVKALMDFFSPEVLEADLDRLLYETVDKVGDGCQRVAKYLVKHGARPWNAVVEGSTLVHAAVKSNSANLLRFVVDKLLDVQGDIEDSRDASGRSIFETALDANASPMYTFPGWWEMMEYLVRRLTPLPISTAPAERLDIYAIGPNDLKNRVFQLMFSCVYDEDLFDQSSYLIGIEIKPLEQNNDNINMVSKLDRFVSYTSWSGISQNLITFRRYSLLKDFKLKFDLAEVSPLQMLAHYRGTQSLTLKQHELYRNMMMAVLKREQYSLSDTAKFRIYKNLWNNVADKYDFVDCLYLTRVLGPDVTYNSLYWTVRNQIERWNNDIFLSSYQKISVRERITQTRVDYMQGRFDRAENEPLIDLIIGFLEHLGELNTGGRSLHLLDCLRQRLRRDIRSEYCISWTDVDEFNDAVHPRVLSEISVNSDKFLQALAKVEMSDKIKARRLVGLVRELQLEPNAEGLITGSSKMLVQDVLEQGSLSAYRQSRRIADLTGKLWHSSARPRKFMALLPRRTTALYIGSQIPLVHALFAAIDACLQHRVDPSDKRCWYGAGMFGLSVLLGPVGSAAVKYTPRMVDQFSRVALELLPSKAPAFLRENIYIVRNIGLKYGARALSTGLMIVGIGFDIYNIVTMSQAIAECNRKPDLCTSRDKAEYIISLTFSCLSIVVTGGLMITGVGIVPAIIIQLHLMVLEHLALGINDAVYYATKYHTTFGETFRIFWRKFLGMSQSSDITALVEHKELIEHLRRQVKQILDDETNKDVIAYAIGVGSLVSGARIVAGHGIIDMSREDVKNTENLSRVMPQADSDTIRLCLPQEHSTAGYYDYANSVSTAKYRCVNSFVLGHKKRWESGATDRSYIVYDLRYISEGLVMGSNSINNLFLIHNGTSKLHIIAGNGNITNTYIIPDTSFRGSILLYDSPSQNILNLATIDSDTMPRFHWYATYHTGNICFHNTSTDCFQLHAYINATPHLRIIGRAQQADHYNCDYTNQNVQNDDDQRSLVIDGNGGKSFGDMDTIIDCKVSIVRPFTHLIGSDSPNVMHTAYMKLDYVPTSNECASTVPVIIEPRRSKFIIIFENQSLLANINSVTYNRSSKIISWNIRYSRSYSLMLNVTRFSASRKREINCLFVDSSSKAMIHPVIHRSSKKYTNDIIHIHTFHVFATVSSSSLTDVISHYRSLTAFWESQFFVVTKFTHSQTGKTFVFGSKKSEHFYIDANTTFVYGSDGHDVYVLSQQPPKYVQIDNRATDRALDTLLILNSTCNSLSVRLDSLTLQDSYSEFLDVTLVCATDSDTPGVNIVLRNYLIEPEYRHLKIIWNDAVYVLLPIHWTRGDDPDSATEEDVKLGLVYSFSAHLDALTLTSRNTRYLVLNTTESRDSLLAYRPPMSNNVLITQKSGDHHSISFVILENFFSADTNYTAVSAEWQHLKIFVTADVDDDEVTPTVLTAQSVQNLIVSTVIEDFIDAATNGDPITEYVVDMTSNASKTTDIQHNSETQSGKHDRLGVLVVIGANPGDFRAEWSTNDSNSLSLCAHGSCTVVRNWCLSPRHQLYRWEFISGLSRRPIVITNLNKLTDCQQRASDTSGLSLVQLNDKLTAAQKHLSLTTDDDDSDRARLIRCVGSIFAYSVAHDSIHKLFGFTSSIDHAAFVEKNCHSLITSQNLEQLSLQIMNTTIQNTLSKYEHEFTEDELHSAGILRETLKYLSDLCWNDFRISLYQLYKNNSENKTLGIIGSKFQDLNKISNSLSNCRD